MKPPGQLSQLVMLRLEDIRWSPSLERVLRDLAPGGILLDRSLPPSAEETSEFLLKVARPLPCPPILALREEGGAHDPLRQFLPGLPSPRAAAEKGREAVGRLGELIGEGLSLLGFNSNFAPPLDLRTSVTGKSLGARAFGSDPQKVAECGGAFLRGLERHRILACGKHFPGLGSVPLSGAPAAPAKLPVSGKPMAALWREDLLPYRELLPRLPMVLVSSAAYKAYDFDRPRAASLSPLVVQGLLRVKLGYRGLAVAYDLESEEVRGALNLGDAATQSIGAGCDMLILDSLPATEAAGALEMAVSSGKIPHERIEETLARIRAAKKRLVPPTGKVARRALDDLARRIENFSKEFRPEEVKIA